MVTPRTNYQPSVGIASTLYTRNKVAANLVPMPSMYVRCDDTQVHKDDDRCALPVVVCGGDVRRRTQGGRGLDHLAKVQQRKAQTERRFLHPLGYSYPFHDSLTPIIFQSGGVLVTLQVSLTN